MSILPSAEKSPGNENDTFVRHVQAVSLGYSTSLTNFSVEVSVVRIPFKENNRVIFLRLHQSEAVNILKIKLQRIKRKLRGVKNMFRGTDKNMERSVLFSVPLFLLLSAAWMRTESHSAELP